MTAPSVPRIAYDLDDARVVMYSLDNPTSIYTNDGSEIDGHPVEVTRDYLRVLNGNEGATFQLRDYIGTSRNRLVLLLPRTFDLLGIYVYAVADNSTPVQYDVQVSSASGNGIDGVWTELGPTLAEVVPASDEAYLDSIQWFGSPVHNVQAIKLLGPRPDASLKAAGFPSAFVHHLHLYGRAVEPYPVQLWHPDSDSELPWFDLGRVALSTSKDVRFRVKNPTVTDYRSVSLRLDVKPAGSDREASLVEGMGFAGAGSIAVTFTPSDGEYGTYPFGYTYETDPVPAGATSEVITLRCVVPRDASPGPFAARLVATPNV